MQVGCSTATMPHVTVFRRDARQQRTRTSEGVDISEMPEIVWADILVDLSSCTSLKLEYSNDVSTAKHIERLLICVGYSVQVLQRQPRHLQAAGNHAHSRKSEEVELQ